MERFADYLEDLHRFLEVVGRRAGGPPRTALVGHSMGGLVAFWYAVAHPEAIAALVLCAPWFGLRMRVDPVQRALAPLMARLLPRLRRPAGIPPEDLSRDPEVVRAYREDPLVGTTVTPRWFVECSRAAERARGLAARLSVPVLFLQGDADRIVDPEATRAVFESVGHHDKTFRLYPGRYHELFNDPGYPEVFADVADWLQARGLGAELPGRG